MTREPASEEALLAELELASGADPWFDRAVEALREELRAREERRARRVAELAALCLQGSLLLRHAPPEISEAFVASRFLPDGPWRTAGTLPAAAHTETMLNRVTPTNPASCAPHASELRGSDRRVARVARWGGYGSL